MVGSNSQNFNPSASAADLTTVLTAKTLGKGNYSLGVFLHAAANSLPYYTHSGEDGASRSKINDTLTTAELGLAIGILRNLDLGIMMPAVLIQTVNNTEDRHGQVAKRGFTEMRLNAKLALLQIPNFALATIFSTNVNLTRNNPYDGDQSLHAYNIELAATSDLSLVEISANLGYRIMQGRDLNDYSKDAQAFGNQLIASAGAAFKVPTTKTQIITELYMSAPSHGEFENNSRKSTRAEALAGVKYQANDRYIYQAGMGSEVIHSTSSADWRIYAGLHYVFQVQKSQAQDLVEPLNPAAAMFSEDDAYLTRKPDEVIVIQDVLFKFNSDQLADSAANQEQIDRLVEALRRGDGFEKLVIEGHTCSIGGDRYNNRLSQRRAIKMRSLLINNFGFRAKSIVARGMGERVPVVSNHTEEGRKRNRRVEFKIFRKALVTQSTLGRNYP